MTVFKEMAQRLQGIDINSFVRIAVEKNQQQITDITTGRIFKTGRGIDEKLNYQYNRKSKLAPNRNYTARYANKKAKAGKLQSHVDLSFEGSFLKTFGVKADSNGFFVQSKGAKAGSFDLSSHLRKTYPEYEGLSEHEIQLVNQIIINDIIQLITNSI